MIREKHTLRREQALEKRRASGAIRIPWHRGVLDGDGPLVSVEALGRRSENRHVAVEEERRVAVDVRGRELSVTCGEQDQLAHARKERREIRQVPSDELAGQPDAPL